MKGVWLKDINGLEDCEGYRIYEDGKLTSFKQGREKIMRFSFNGRGYHQVSIQTTNGKRKTFKAHRLVALAFIPNPKEKPQVNHIDGNKTNNHYKNLEWATNSENQIHANKNGLRKPARGEDNYQYNSEHKNCKKVRQLTLDGLEVTVHNSLAMAGRSVNKGYTTISKCCNGEFNTAYGFKWEFVQ